MHFHSWLVGMRMAMEMMVTGDSISGLEAARLGWATRAYPIAELEPRVVEMAQRIATLPPDIVQLNKRTVHRQMDIMGIRAAIRAGTELCALGTHQKSFHEFIAKMQQGLTAALQERDAPFGDYRTSEKKPAAAE
jgi:enoyl-CoA hydratase